MNRTDRGVALAKGRVYLQHWLQTAQAHGTIYYTIPHVARSGMSRRIVLGTIVPAKHKGTVGPMVARYDLQMLWPRTLDRDDNEALDIIGKDWRFSFKHRAFVVDGCGMDMVFALVDSLAARAGLPGYANLVRREHFG